VQFTPKSIPIFHYIRTKFSH